eukprot:613924-Lingulodinium_polyedra.AAC.1
MSFIISNSASNGAELKPKCVVVFFSLRENPWGILCPYAWLKALQAMHRFIVVLEPGNGPEDAGVA